MVLFVVFFFWVERTQIYSGLFFIEDEDKEHILRRRTNPHLCGRIRIFICARGLYKDRISH
jgi:hypothetical protein